MPSAIEEVRAILEDRGRDYGPVRFGAEQTGRVWAAIISEQLQTEIPDIPPHVVLLMMAAMKINRAVRPFRQKQDNYTDGIAYVQLAEDAFLEEGIYDAMPNKKTKSSDNREASEPRAEPGTERTGWLGCGRHGMHWR